MSVTFTKMVPVKSYQHVVKEIETAICNEQFKKGERLPSEMKLKEMFETSRGTIREALRVLEQKGLVAIRTGVKGGAVVKDVNTDAMSESMALLVRQRKISLQHLAEFRELLEGHAAEQAARFSNRIQVEELHTLIVQIKELLAAGPKDWKEFHKLDAAFHKTIARMADNPLLQANLETIHANIETYFDTYLPFSRSLLEEDYHDLMKIYQAIAQGDSKAAGKHARQHVSKFSKLMGMSGN